jgi:hypothetical protein
MSYVPEFVALYEIYPFIRPILDNESIHNAVYLYFLADYSENDKK